MGQRLNWSKWKQSIEKLYKLLMLDNKLKYFPPHFRLRDPINSLVKSFRHHGGKCSVIVINFSALYYRHANGSIGDYVRTQMNFQAELLNTIKNQINEEHIIAVQHVDGAHISIYVDFDRFGSFDALFSSTQLLVKAIETALYPIYGSDIHDLQGGCCMLDDMVTEPDSAIAMESAVYYAMAVAAKKLPAHFSKMRDRLKSIVDSEEILVLAQPIMNLKQGDIIGWEILTRGPLNTPYHQPAELFEFAYEADLLPKLELIVMKKAFQEIAERSIHEQVFINITPVSLGLPYFLNEILKNLSRYPQISPSQIVFEITERHSIRDFAHMGSIIAKYRSFGFRFAVDDTGSGYSSLQTISELIPDIIKIDKSVISNIDQVAVKQLLLKALVLFAQNINCQVIAEGVEREEESDMLQSLEVPMGQGFYFAKPESISHHRERVVHFSELKRKLLEPKVSSA